MFDNIFSKLKRRRLDENLSANRDGFGANVASNLNNIWDHLFGDNDASSTTTNTQNINNSRSGTAGDMSMAVDRFVTVLDQLDSRVEKFRKDALGLQEKRDFLLMSIDLIKSNDLMQNLSESEREEIGCYIQRVNARLSTVELNVRTVRDQSQEDSLSQINALIDMMITLGDPALSRQKCQMYLNACCSASETGTMSSFAATDMDAGPVDKKFESVLLGCTLDDQKNIKKRLQALMGYLNKQIVHH
ncbi:BAG family molecular chaperone regulator 2 isoform X4 [Musca domestica]|uniref:BAG family molecular chaperone regulator 2 isoform X4 n=1 Tax=Musca domestica TaxID=7370 RepID=A0A1I8N7F7_MUSDO|nr:BAG family molecular chaperone regulator 2 isoform X4 [Musca domestica]